ncbi:MAG: carboxymuconolactone decarboxylase family protein [Ilumatobacter sp.]|nr:MAG: carboxymuconolactone decarboxylase family protein [Ilumatobacter sp.]
MSETPTPSAATLIDELREPTRSLRRAIPGTFKAFAGLHAEALGDGALSASTKELIALAIGVSKQCDGCIAYHAKAAAHAGATAEEVAEMLGVVLLMDGGPATVYGPRAYAAYLEFTEGSSAG